MLVITTLAFFCATLFEDRKDRVPPFFSFVSLPWLFSLLKTMTAIKENHRRVHMNPHDVSIFRLIYEPTFVSTYHFRFLIKTIRCLNTEEEEDWSRTYHVYLKGLLKSEDEAFCLFQFWLWLIGPQTWCLNWVFIVKTISWDTQR